MTDSPNYQAFHDLVGKTNLTSDEKHQAWELFHHEGENAAVAYVTQIQATYGEKRQKAGLHSSPLPYGVWGQDYIDEASFEQMNYAMRLPISVAGALMPDAHKGYGLPIGGVLATDNTVIPYAVGVDIACRMMITLYAVAPDVLENPESSHYHHLKTALVENTTFGAGAAGLHEGKLDHAILDESKWQATPLLKSLRKTAIYQVGTSGTGNHFVEWGVAEILMADNPLHVPPGTYLALLSHSGSRGVGYKIADHYSKLAMALMPELPDAVKHLAWLDLDSEAGQEYWHAMHLAGEFASANHHLIHERVAAAAGLTPVAMIENHHNFAWKEQVNGREVVVHRKGATPAGQGVLGIIPGTMADKGYLVVGKGEAKSLQSASHGGGRMMSRTQAKKTITTQQHAEYLKSHHVTLIGGGLDESPQAYKEIAQVIGAQADLVDILGTFQPRLVRMASDELSWKDRKKKGGKQVPEGVIDAEGD